MRFSVDKNQMQRALSVVSKAVSPRSPMQILESIKISALIGKITLYSTDTEIFIKDEVEAKVERGGEFIVNCKNIYDIIRAFPSERVYFERIEGEEKIKIYSPSCEFILSTKSVEEYPREEEIHFSDFISVKGDDLRNMIQKTAFACAAGASNIALTGVLVNLNGDVLEMIGVDGFKLAMRKMKVASPYNEQRSAVVPARILLEIAKIISPDEEVLFSVEEKKFSLKSKSTLIISNVLNCKFINYENIIQRTYNIKASLMKDDFLHSCERALLLNETSLSNVMVLFFSNGKLKMTTSSSIGELKEEIPLLDHDEEIKIAFNPRYLLDILKVIEDEVITIEMINPLSQIAISSQEHGYLYILTPIRHNSVD